MNSTDESQRMQCMEVWGGNVRVERHFQTPGLDVWISCQPEGQADAGGDVYYLSSCASGRITRILLADVSGHGELVASTAAGLRDLMRKGRENGTGLISFCCGKMCEAAAWRDVAWLQSFPPADRLRCAASTARKREEGLSRRRVPSNAVAKWRRHWVAPERCRETTEPRPHRLPCGTLSARPTAQRPHILPGGECARYPIHHTACRGTCLAVPLKYCGEYLVIMAVGQLDCCRADGGGLC